MPSPATLVLAAAILGTGCRGSITTPGSFLTDIKVANKALVVDHCVIDNVHTTALSRIFAAFSRSSWKLHSVKCWRDEVELPPGIVPPASGGSR